MIMNRRKLIVGLGAIFAAPAIVRATSLMPIKSWIDDGIALRAISHPINTAGADFILLTVHGFDAFGKDITETAMMSREAYENGSPLITLQPFARVAEWTIRGPNDAWRGIEFP